MLARRYRLEERLSQTADGSMWRALDQTLERQVSVRVLLPDHPYGADVVDAARRAALIDDSRLARVLDVGESEGLTYIVSEQIQGRVLADLLERGPLPAETVRRIVGETAQALDRAGIRGLHHLRLSPTSVVIVPDGSVKLLGTAIEAAVAGAESNDSTAANRADAIGLVSLLYAGLTGRWPGVSDGPLGPAPRLSGRAVPPGELVPGVPNDLDTLCTVTLGPHDDGPRSPHEVAGELSPWAHVAPLTDPRGLALSAGRPAMVDPVAGLVPQTPKAGVATAESEDEAVQPEDEPDEPEDEPVEVAGEVADGPAQALTVDAQADDSNDSNDEGRPDDDATDVTDAPNPDPADPPTTEIALDALQVQAASADPLPAGQADTPPSLTLPAAVQQARTSPWRSRVTDLERGDQAWPKPAPAAALTGVVTPPGTTIDPRDGAADLADEILGQASGPGMLRMAPTPPPPIGQAAELPWGGPAGWGDWGTQDPHLERLGPFMPPVPLTRPPKDQTRLVLAVVAGLVVLGLILAVVSFWSFLSPSDSSARTVPSAGATSSGSASVEPSPSADATTGTGVVPSGPLLRIASVRAIDPQGDGRENSGQTARVLDGDPTTTWRSESYGSATFAGTTSGKTGVGLVLDLGRATTVSAVSIDAKGSGGAVQVRAANRPDYAGSTVVGTATLTGSTSNVVLTRPTSTRYLVLWFTRLSKIPGEKDFRVVIGEVDAR